jgi:hypothetical protein
VASKTNLNGEKKTNQQNSCFESLENPAAANFKAIFHKAQVLTESFIVVLMVLLLSMSMVVDDEDVVFVTI